MTTSGQISTRSISTLSLPTSKISRQISTTSRPEISILNSTKFVYFTTSRHVSTTTFKSIYTMYTPISISKPPSAMTSKTVSITTSTTSTTAGVTSTTYRPTPTTITSTTSKPTSITTSISNFTTFLTKPTTTFIVSPTIIPKKVPTVVPGVTSGLDTIHINGNTITLTLSWGEPFNNFDPIMNYTVSCSGDVTCPPNFTTTDNNTRSYTVTNLTPMATYTFSVVATNSIGSGEAGVVMITTPPGKDV